LLFDNKKEYLPLRNALEQLYEIIPKKDYQYLTEVINNSILYCYNSKPKCLFSFSIFRSKNNILTMRESPEFQSNYSINNNIVSTENLPSIPFIKSSMKKKFCLVLDIDETISHSLKLSFGCYFLVRPGALDFLKEVSKYYEIIIFTSSPKSYADKILNKIDINGNLISHRLYRNHVIYENGKSAKNLNMIGRDLTKTIFIDNLMSNAKYNLNNLCPITTWISDIFDDKLIKLKNKLIYIATSGKYDNDITQGL
jgi:Dullard-like phosphatase family protein